jgi:hypothetical protein
MTLQDLRSFVRLRPVGTRQGGEADDCCFREALARVDVGFHGGVKPRFTDQHDSILPKTRTAAGAPFQVRWQRIRSSLTYARGRG